MPRFEREDFLTPKQRIRSFIDTAQEDRNDIVQQATKGFGTVAMRAEEYIWLVRALKQEFPKNDKT